MKKLIFILLFVPIFTYSQQFNKNLFIEAIVNPISPNYGIGIMYLNDDECYMLDVKMKNRFLSDYKHMSSMDNNQAIAFGDLYKSSDNVDWVINAGFGLVVKRFILYTTVGMSSVTYYNNWFDSSYILGNEGNYATKSYTDYNVNFEFGIKYIIKNKLVIRTGVETYTRGFIIGFGYKL